MTPFRTVETIVFILAGYFTLGSLTTVAVSALMALTGRSYFDNPKRRWMETYGDTPAPVFFFWAWPLAWLGGTIFLLGRAWMKATERASDAAMAAADRYHKRLRGAA